MASTNFRQRLDRWLLRLPAPLRWWKLAHLPQTTLATMRQDYGRGVLDEDDLDPDPVRQFERWLGDAVAAKFPDPNAMTLATTGSDGRPGARTVLLKAFDARGFVFFTNYESRKSRQLAECPQAALLFTWLSLERQIEICGHVEKVSAEESSNYFNSRPLASRVGAWASPQSQVIRSRAELESHVTAAIERFRSEPLTVPPFWGGYRVVPVSLEFWQGRPGRLHDRLRYVRNADGAWTVERLAP